MQSNQSQVYQSKLQKQRAGVLQCAGETSKSKPQQNTAPFFHNRKYTHTAQHT